VAEEEVRVVGSNWLVAISQVPDELLPEVCANVAQLEEWKALHSLHELPSDVTRPAYSEPLTPEYLKAHSSLMVDTRHFDAAFVARLLDEAGDLDEKADGVLVHSENFQALSLMQAHYRKKVQCIYIDPPYNTGGDGFAYKDHYQRSSWLSMASQVLSMSRLLMDQGSAFFASCDDNEVARARELLDCEFGAERLESQIIVQSNKRGQTYKSIARTHEYLLSYGNDDLLRLNGLPKEVEDGPTDEMGQYEYWELRNRNPKFGRFNRPNLFYPIFASQNQVAELGVSRVSVERTDEYSVEILPRNSAGDDSCWRWSAPKVDGAAKDGLLTIVAKQTRAGDWRVFEKSRKSYTAPKSIWSETDVINEKGTVELGAMGLKNFGFPKPTGLLEKVVRIGSPDDGLTLDYFAGSGTTGHAAISLNREDAGQRKFVLVEQGDHFDSVLMPRINKVTFTPDWKDGKPKRLATEEEAERSPRTDQGPAPGILRGHPLNNLALSRSTQQQAALDFCTAQGADGLREQYLLRYQLYVESQGSASLLNIAAFSDPTA
jgi:adenine-specific DNA-methyltransferase